MKSFIVLASLAACTLAQRLHIAGPTAGQTVGANSYFTAELQMDNTLSSMSQKSVLIALTACYDVCSQPAQWGPGTVLYNGTFNPQYNVSAPQKGLYQDFRLQLPEGWPSGESVLSVAHQFTVGASEIPVFDYTTVHFNVTDPENPEN
ncbi:uncharacterized protein PHACADRAFT_253293 [Phanerochaete carnosa HHB-10118-sp]|uniref:Uncharacterized protein n=1 Tax=Phanerochaete carnosa (strain HHB-10118-sp) TaxID=650164 RepID=K5V196_PHACS|nr:uncharacterized protein PHACADRAFT_253293 [Phanerochaete carnosa HHB-10118-sp]EKM56261.1 hypothetical protein PHACADRAFT_253293 [Phanerochaete carnosa HHB-10118-sp]